MYYHPLTFVTSARGKRVEELAVIALYIWARQQKMRIEAMEAICADRRRATRPAT